jgi:acyl-CoA thioester hydrolase
MSYKKTFTTRWADFDPNRHMRHTAYNDYAAEIRVRFFDECGLSINEFAKLHIGPVLFKEETSFFKEINLGEDIQVSMELEAASKQLERWQFVHHIYNQKGILAAEVKVYGAWIDLNKRKLTSLPEKYQKLIREVPKSKDFTEILLKDK